MNFIILFCFLYLFNQPIDGYSITKNNFKLATSRCFNHSKITGNMLKLGQEEPIGITIENLISLMERFENLNPQYSPREVIKIFMKRFETFN